MFECQPVGLVYHLVFPITNNDLAETGPGFGGDVGCRQDFQLPVIAVGGSNGKTSTKEILATVLGQRLETLSSEASFNNDIGVPLTLLRLREAHEAAVLEVGSNHPGELQPLLQLIRTRY